MKDQYENKVPDDLVLIPALIHLSEEDAKKVSKVEWYDVIVYMGDGETATILCVSAKAIDYLSEEEISGEILEVLKVNNVLKRWDDENGDFYHA